MIAFLFLSCCIENTKLSAPSNIGEVVQFASADGSVVLRPTMKYDLFECMLIAVGSDADFDLAPFGISGNLLSEEGLKFQKFARERISDELVEDIKRYILFNNALSANEIFWWLQNVMWKCPETNDIDRIIGYIKGLNEADLRWTSEKRKAGIIENRTNIAKTIKEFWNGAFYDYYSNLYPELVAYCGNAIKEVDIAICERFSGVGILGFLEKWSGRTFENNTRILFYPNPFLNRGAFVISETEEPYVISINIAWHVNDWIMVPFHEMSHHLLRDMVYSKEFYDLTKDIESTEYDENLFRTYGDMWGVVEEYCVAAFDIFLRTKAGFIDESEALQHQYYRTDLCLDITEYLLKNHRLGEDIGETFLEFFRSRTKEPQKHA
jgi:hypothetical protein